MRYIALYIRELYTFFEGIYAHLVPSALWTIKSVFWDVIVPCVSSACYSGIACSLCHLVVPDGYIALKIPLVGRNNLPALQDKVSVHFASWIFLSSLELENKSRVDWLSSNAQLLGIAGLSCIGYRMPFWRNAKPYYFSTTLFVSLSSSFLDSRHHHHFLIHYYHPCHQSHYFHVRVTEWHQYGKQITKVAF